MRPGASVTGTRCTRCTPPSNLSRLNAPSPSTSAITSFIPPIPVVLDDQDLDLPAAPLGVARVHAEELRGEQRGLVATRAGADLEDDVALVVGIARHEQHLQALVERVEPGFDRGQLAARHLANLGVGVLQQLAVLRHVALETLPLAIALDHRLELRALARQLGVLATVGDDRRVGDETLQLLVPPFDLCETLEHARPSRPLRGGSPGRVSRPWRPLRRSCRSGSRFCSRTCG